MKRKVLSVALAVTLAAGLLQGGVAAAAQGMAQQTEQGTVQLLQEGDFPGAAPVGYEQDELETGTLSFPLAAPEAGTAADALYQGLVECRPSIDLGDYRITRDELNDIYQNLVNTSPELFYLGNSYRYTQFGQVVLSVIPTYTNTREEIQKMQMEYRQALDAILAGVGDDWSDVEIALYLHDYLAAHFEYDYTYSRYDAYSFLTTGSGVCQAYTLTYTALLNELDIPVDYVISETMNHAWNAVNIGGEWYHVDITWDDSYGYGLAGHENFLVSDKRLAALEHEDWYYTVEPRDCSSTRYDDGVWTGTRTPFVQLGDEWYYIGEKENGWYAFFSTDLQTAWEEYPLSAQWNVGDSSSYWLGFYSGLGVYQGELIWNTPTAICLYDPVAQSVQTLLEPERGGASLYGFALDGVELTYVLKTSPNEREEELHTVRLAELTGISIASLPEKTEYRLGEELDVSGLQLTLTYSDTTTRTLSTGFTVSGYDAGKAGTQTLTVAYEGKTATFQVTVRQLDYIITYDTNGGSGAPAPQTFKNGEGIALSSTLPVRPGYTFAGWVTAEDPDLLYPAGAFCWLSGDTVFYAVWVRNDGAPDLGNIDGRDGVTAADALTVLQAATGKVQLDAAKIAVADVDGNGEVTAGDALLILQYATQKIGHFFKLKPEIFYGITGSGIACLAFPLPCFLAACPVGQGSKEKCKKCINVKNRHLFHTGESGTI